jgi:hypothetical protein
MNCCTQCFQADKVISFIQKAGVVGECDFCGAEDVQTMTAADLGGYFSPLIDLYEEADDRKYHEGESLADLLSVWKVFSDKLPIDKQNAILDEIRFGPIDPKEMSISRRSHERWQFKFAYWEEEIWEKFSEYIKHQRRFILGDKASFYFSEPLTWLPEILSACEMTVDTDLIFFRARRGCSEKKSVWRDPYSSCEMSPPPGDLTRNGGRANPPGISYFYVAEEAETAIAEIRPFVGGLVSVCSIKAMKPLKVADITRIHEIKSPFGQTDLEAQVQRNALLNILNRELARPVNPDDSEIEYVPTQYLAEAILDLGYDGIRYRSAVRIDGTNFVFFNPKDLDIDSKTWLVEVKSIDVKYDRV